MVVSKIAHDRVKIGDWGTAEGPSLNAGAADAAQRVNVDFGRAKGSRNMLATSQIEGAPLARGWVKFDVVLSRIEHNGIEIGDQGVVMGPSNNSKAQDAAERVNVDFGAGKGKVNMLASSQIEGVALAGGLVKGDVVISKIEHMKVKVGDQGIVCGPSTKPSAEDAAERVSVNFGTEKGPFNMQVVLQVQGIPLVGGWIKGDKVISKIRHGGVEEGDEGTVVGPSSNASAEDADQRVCIAFGKERKRINTLVATQIDGAPLAGGWVKGDLVVSRIKYKEVEEGQEGVVLGPSSRAFTEDACERVCVDFGERGGCTNMLAESHIKGVTLAGGWMKGDVVASKIKHNSLQVGDEGVVKGPSSNPRAPDASSRVCVYFGREKGHINMLARMQIKGVKLAGSWVKGDVVVSKIKHKEVEIGDTGTVVGPTSNPKAADANNRVCVDFGPSKGSLNMLALSQIELPLPGGWIKADQVISTKACEGPSGRIAIGDQGIIVGPAMHADAQAVTRQVRVDFGGDKGTTDMDAFNDLARATSVSAEEMPKLERDERSEQQTKKAGGEVDVNSFNNEIGDGPCLAAAYRAVNEEKVRALFVASASRQYKVTRVEMVRSECLVRRCSHMLDSLGDQRAGRHADVFSTTLPKDIDDSDRQAKARLASLLKLNFTTAEWASPGSRLSNVVPVWYGAREDVLRKISQVGFSALAGAGSGGPGWLGAGRYNALEADLACLTASRYTSSKPTRAKGEWVVLLSAAVVGLAYPVTPGKVDFPAGPLPPTDPKAFRFYGKPFKAPCDTHVAGIDGSSLLCVSPECARYHEVVSTQDDQLLPLALVFFAILEDP